MSDAVTRRTTLGALGGIAPFLQGGCKGINVFPRPQGYSVLTLKQLKAAPATGGPLSYDQAVFAFLIGDYTGQPDDENIIQSDYVAIDQGAWVRQGADKVAFTPAGTGATTRDSASVIASFGLQARSYGAAEDGVNDDRMPLSRLLAAAASATALMAKAYSVSAGPKWNDIDNSDPEPAALTHSASNTVIDGQNTGSLLVDTADKGVLHIKNASEANRPTGVVVRHITLGQPYSSIIGTGLTDDYFTLRFEACENCIADNVRFAACELALTFQFAQTVAYTDRSSKRNRSRNCYAPSVAFMFLQLFGEQGGVHTGHFAYGIGHDGTSRAASHGIRLAGFGFAHAKDNRVTDHVMSRFSNGLSLQAFVRNNVISLTAIDCRNGASVARQADSHGSNGSHTAADATAQNNTVSLTSTGGDYALFDDGGSRNTWDIDASGFAVRGINATNGGGTAGLAMSNTYRGRLYAPVAGSTVRMAQLDGANTTVDLDIEGTGSASSDTAFGLLSTGAGLFGSVRASNCQIGVQLNGSGARIDATVANCGTALVIGGNSNVVFCNIDGNVTVAGSNNVLLGRVSGTVTDTGTSNRIQISAQSGWTVGTGTANKGAFAAYAGAAIGAAYSQTEAQATNDAVKDASQRILALEQAMRNAGLIT